MGISARSTGKAGFAATSVEIASTGRIARHGHANRLAVKSQSHRYSSIERRCEIVIPALQREARGNVVKCCLRKSCAHLGVFDEARQSLHQAVGYDGVSQQKWLIIFP